MTISPSADEGGSRLVGVAAEELDSNLTLKLMIELCNVKSILEGSRPGATHATLRLSIQNT
jgi:hypothetical protein